MPTLSEHELDKDKLFRYCSNCGRRTKFYSTMTFCNEQQCMVEELVEKDILCNHVVEEMKKEKERKAQLEKMTDEIDLIF